MGPKNKILWIKTLNDFEVGKLYQIKTPVLFNKIILCAKKEYSEYGLEKVDFLILSNSAVKHFFLNSYWIHFYSIKKI